jgi:hypothetical protein
MQSIFKDLAEEPIYYYSSARRKDREKMYGKPIKFIRRENAAATPGIRE